MDETQLDWTALDGAIARAIVPVAPPRPGGAAADSEAVRAEARRLLRDAEASRLIQPGVDPVRLRGFLDGVRSAVLDHWAHLSRLPAAAKLLATLNAIERVAAATRAPADRLPDGYEFAAGVAHDLRSPLTSILFLAETLLTGQSGEINDAQRRQLGIIYSAALGLVTVASDIIELVRGGEGLTEREPIPFSVTEILESVRDIVRPMAEERGLAVHLFPPAEDLRTGFPLALSRVLLNLTTNALKFTDHGFVEIAVRSISPNRLEFSVRDTGRGYSPEALETLYEPFRQTRPGKHFGFSGSGLGLAISRKLVRALGSTLEVETRPKWGTRFYFEIDLPPVPPAAARAADPAASLSRPIHTR